ncbi:hypothetical protein ACFQX9_19345 [Bradyrhizobium sp. GCM10028915]
MPFFKGFSDKSGICPGAIVNQITTPEAQFLGKAINAEGGRQ